MAATLAFTPRALVTQHDGYFRPSEVIEVRAHHVHLRPASAALTYPLVSITICPSTAETNSPADVRTKAGKTDDTVVFGDSSSRLAGRAWVADLLAGLKRKQRGFARLFPLSLSQYEHAFNKSVLRLGLAALHATPHCCRHGGASGDAAAAHRNIADIARRGRWESAASVKRYEKHGRYM